ncbi:MAG TPA: ROK family protein [Polyangia bacterium]|jgi:polyphosphate glucokinase|nr:ROK family protein [Polyangia bacterium]
MKILVIDVGGTHVKVQASGQRSRRRLPSGPGLTPYRMVLGVRDLISGWHYDVVTIGAPTRVQRGKIAAEPANLGRGWTKFDFSHAFERPVKLINDAAMQALGAYEGGRMLFLGLGTGLGTAMIADGVVVPMELAHLPYKKATYEDYVGLRGLERNGKKKWRRDVADVVGRLAIALETEDLVLGGGNSKHLKKLPPGARRCTNADAIKGGYRLWAEPDLQG